MNKQKVLEELRHKYSGKAIICLPEDNPTEILCEIHPVSEHADYSVAVSIVDASKPHVHKETTEEYEVIKGSLVLDKDGTKYPLSEGDTITITPGEVHYAVGNETWVRVTSHPGWMPSDHILVTENDHDYPHAE